MIPPYELRRAKGEKMVAIFAASGHCLNAFTLTEEETASIHPDGIAMPPDEMLAHFRLMACAPELLAACCEALDWGESAVACGIDGESGEAP
jgi:hypothetical protein